MSKKKEQKIIELLKDQDIFKVMSIEHINHKPHPYMIGTSHIAFASDNYMGRLGKEAITEGERINKCRCYFKGTNGRTGDRCNLPYESHTSDEVCFLQLLRNCSNKEASGILFMLKTELGEDFIDGFGFVETKEKFKIANPILED